MKPFHKRYRGKLTYWVGTKKKGKTVWLGTLKADNNKDAKRRARHALGKGAKVKPCS